MSVPILIDTQSSPTLLTIIPSLDGGQSLLVLLNQVGQFEHQDTTISGWQQLPGGILESLASGLHSDINILLTGSIY